MRICRGGLYGRPCECGCKNAPRRFAYFYSSVEISRALPRRSLLEVFIGDENNLSEVFIDNENFLN